MPFLPFFGVLGSPTNIEKQERSWYPYSSTSLLEDLANVETKMEAQRVWSHLGCGPVRPEASPEAHWVPLAWQVRAGSHAWYDGAARP